MTMPERQKKNNKKKSQFFFRSSQITSATMHPAARVHAAWPRRPCSWVWRTPPLPARALVLPCPFDSASCARSPAPCATNSTWCRCWAYQLLFWEYQWQKSPAVMSRQQHYGRPDYHATVPDSSAQTQSQCRLCQCQQLCLNSTFRPRWRLVLLCQYPHPAWQVHGAVHHAQQAGLSCPCCSREACTEHPARYRCEP